MNRGNLNVMHARMHTDTVCIFYFSSLCIFGDPNNIRILSFLVKPNNIRIRIRSFLGSRIIFVFVFGHQNTIRSALPHIYLGLTIPASVLFRVVRWRAQSTPSITRGIQPISISHSHQSIIHILFVRLYQGLSPTLCSEWYMPPCVFCCLGTKNC